MSPRLTATSDDRRKPDPVRAALAETRNAWLHVGIFSSVVNLLMLTGSFYMMQVFDRVLASQSITTLVVISLIALMAYALQCMLDTYRMRILARIGAIVDDALFARVAQASVRLPIRGIPAGDVLQPMRDLEALRTFLSGLGPTALLDMPFLPLFLAGCFLLHPVIGWCAVIGGGVIVLLTMVIERRSAALGEQIIRAATENGSIVEAGRRNAEVIAAMGMESTHVARLSAAHRAQVDHTLQLSDVTGVVGNVAKTFRLVLQSAILGAGALLIIWGEMSAGATLAASILVGRALAPVELAVAHWKGFVQARQGYARLSILLRELDEPKRSIALPRPSRQLEIADVAVAAPRTQRLLVAQASFSMQAGQVAGLIGPSGSGKSTLARALVGIWPPARGTIKLDGTSIHQWERETLGQFIGYLPQDVELFDGTVAQNIARFDPDMSSEAVIHAARMAAAHDMILNLPDGYETEVREAGMALSGGQRQRIGLARALYRDPFLVVLDEPNANLDTAGDEALSGAIRAIRARGGITIIITHRRSGLAGVDFIGVLAAGRLQYFGPRQGILDRMEGNPRPAPAAPAREPMLSAHEQAAMLRQAAAVMREHAPPAREAAGQRGSAA
jgi:ATP-binding cassette subfamily C protein